MIGRSYDLHSSSHGTSLHPRRGLSVFADSFAASERRANGWAGDENVFLTAGAVYDGGFWFAATTTGKDQKEKQHIGDERPAILSLNRYSISFRSAQERCPFRLSCAGSFEAFSVESVEIKTIRRPEIRSSDRYAITTATAVIASSATVRSVEVHAGRSVVTAWQFESFVTLADPRLIARTCEGDRRAVFDNDPLDTRERERDASRLVKTVSVSITAPYSDGFFPFRTKRSIE